MVGISVTAATATAVVAITAITVGTIKSAARSGQMRKQAPVEVAAAAKGAVAPTAVATTMKGATTSTAIAITTNRVAAVATAANEMKEKLKTTQTIAASPHHQCKGIHQVIITTTLKKMQRCQIGELVVQRRN